MRVSPWILSFPFSRQNPAAVTDVETAPSRMFAPDVTVYNMMVYGLGFFFDSSKLNLEFITIFNALKF